VIAEKFETLVAVAALARGLQRGDVGEGGGQQRGIGEFVPDARLDRRSGAALALTLPRFFLAATGSPPASGWGLALA
jgi:hypothetical protein